MTLQNTASPSLHPDYRPDIDGLRALAILPVVLFHAFPEIMRSGFVGVDIFFVISGYLISTILLRGLQSGRLGLLDFYARRAKRLFPALLLVLACSYGFAWLALFPREYQQFGRHLAAGAGYAENLLLLQESGYFDLQSQLKPLMHLWSLSVEEQFYFVYPVLLWLAWAARKSAMGWALGGVTVASFALNVIQIRTSTDMAYFAPHTRFWELLAGGLLAYLHVLRPAALLSGLRVHPQARLRLASAASVLGFVLIFLSVFAFTRNELYPGWWAAIPVTGACLVILAGPRALVNRTLLSSRPLVAIGLISYPLYLWHWPLLSFGRILCNATPAPAIQGALFAASFALAWATYRWVETPFKHWPAGNGTKLTVLCLPLAAFFGMGLLTAGEHLPWQVESNALVVKLETAKKDWKFPPAGFVALPTDRIYALRRASQASAEKVLFLGDSNMEQYGARIEYKLAASPDSTLGVLLVPIQKNCDILNAVFSGQGCETQLDELFTLARDASLTRVVLVVAWIKYEKLLAEPANRAKLSQFLNTLAQGKRLFVFRNIPADPDNLAPDAQISRGLSLAGGTIALQPRVSTVAGYNARFADVDAVLRKVALETHATLVSPVNTLCGAGTCPAVDVDQNFLYVDAGHLTARYVRQAAVFIDPLLEKDPVQ